MLTICQTDIDRIEGINTFNVDIDIDNVDRNIDIDVDL